MIIQHNIPSLNAWRNTRINNSGISKNLEKLSSGSKINRAADDAAGLAISEKMRGQIRGTMMGTQNANMGINLIQTAEGGLNETHAILQRMRELAVQSANGTYQDEDRIEINKEFQALKSEIDRIASSTHYNGINLLNVPPMDPGLLPAHAAAANKVLNQLQISASNPPVNANGTFRFFAQNADGDTAQLLFYGGSPFPGTSNPAIRVNGVSYNLSTLSPSTTNTGGVWSTTYTLNDGIANLNIVQRVSVVDNPVHVGGQSYKIDYEVINNNPSVPVTFDLKYHVDTQLAANDHAPFVVNGQGVSMNTSYPRDGSMPEYVSILEGLVDNSIFGIVFTNASSGLPFVDGSEPDRLNVGRFFQTDTYDDLPPGPVGDSGYSLIWENRTVGSESVSMTTYYGVRNPPVDPRLWIQSGANQGDGLYIMRADCRAAALGIYKTAIDPQDAANEAIPLLDSAINYVSSKRADFGAAQNRLESTVRSNGITAENLQAAESSIRDVDMANEMMVFTKNNILVQASQSMLAQANQLPQGVLSLLR